MHDVELKRYSRVDMLSKHEYVMNSKSRLDFIKRYLKTQTGYSYLHIRLSKLNRSTLMKYCSTIRKLSNRKFGIDNLVKWQLEDLLKRNDIRNNLYSLFKNLTIIYETPNIQKLYKGSERDLKRCNLLLSKTMILECERVLASIDESLGTHDFTVELVIELLLNSLLLEMQHGRSNNITEEILSYLKVDRSVLEEYINQRDMA